MKLKHGNRTIEVYVVPEDVLHQEVGDLKPGEFFYGLYKARHPKIFINSETDNKLGSLVHEVGEFIKNEYGLEFTHEQLSVFTQIFSDIMRQNTKLFIKFMEGSV